MKNSYLAIIIPCFNEENRLNPQLFNNFLCENSSMMDFYFVNDGSTDKTAEIITQEILSLHNNVFLINLKKNSGKGNAIRSAILRLENKYGLYGFIDADLQIPLDHLHKLLVAFNGSSSLLAITSRNWYSGMQKFNFRSFSSLLIVMLANSILRLKPRVKDTQCGCKLFKPEILQICFQEKFTSAWLFDLEILLRLRNYYPEARKKIIEVPLAFVEKSKNSKITTSQKFRLIAELVMINSRYN